MDAPKPPAETPEPDHYGAEVLCASWNPVASAVAEPKTPVRREVAADLPAGEADTFLDQFYRSQGS